MPHALATPGQSLSLPSSLRPSAQPLPLNGVFWLPCLVPPARGSCAVSVQCRPPHYSGGLATPPAVSAIDHRRPVMSLYSAHCAAAR